MNSEVSREDSFLETDLNQLSKPELIRLVKALQSKIKSLKADGTGHTHAPKDFDGISGIRRTSPSPASFDSKILTTEGESREQKRTTKYKKATAVMVNELLRKNDTSALDRVFHILRDE